MTEVDTHKIIENFKECCRIIDEEIEEGEIVEESTPEGGEYKIGDAFYAQYTRDELWYPCKIIDLYSDLDECLVKFDVYDNIQRCKLADLRPIDFEWPEVEFTNPEQNSNDTNATGDSALQSSNMQSDIPVPTLPTPESATPEIKQLLSAWYTAGYYAGRFDKQMDLE